MELQQRAHAHKLAAYVRDRTARSVHALQACERQQATAGWTAETGASRFVEICFALLLEQEYVTQLVENALLDVLLVSCGQSGLSALTGLSHCCPLQQSNTTALRNQRQDHNTLRTPLNQSEMQLDWEFAAKSRTLLLQYTVHVCVGFAASTKHASSKTRASGTSLGQVRRKKLFTRLLF